MIISHKHKFIFIKTYKTAGTSLEAYLSEFCGESDVLTPIYPPVEGHRARNESGFYNHMPATEVRKNLDPLIWDSYFKFCVERNPWDKVVSFYWMERYRSGGSLEVEEFLKRDQIGLNWPLYADEEGKRPIVNEILRYESLEADLERTFKKLGVPWTGSLKPKAKTEYRLDRRPYQEVLSGEQADTISQRLHKEIEWHRYDY
jgi:hypothetical protein